MDRKIVGDDIDISLLKNGMHLCKPITGKIDTGAEICSLHGDDISVDGKVVSFAIDGKTFSMPVHEIQSIQSSNGSVEKRPSIILDVKISDMDDVFNDIVFNLSNRSKMEDKLLIGQNLLEKAKFLVDPLKEQEGVNDIENNEDLDSEEEMSDAEVIKTVKQKLEELMELLRRFE